jgi:hypothetical protein
MIWVFALLLAAPAVALAAPAVAREGGPIRTGEHPGFTRVVMEIDPATEWSLETQGGTAVILFPGRAIEFGTDGVWERIPRVRVTSIAAARGPEGARVTLGLGCDCRVTASFVGARRLAIDVIDRGAVAPLPPARETEAAREARETEVVASGEAALAAQIVHAADQGVVQLTVAAPVAPAAAPAPAVESVPAPAARPEAAAPMEGEAEQALSDQIAAISVYDRDDATLAALRQAVPPPEACLPDEAFDLGAWSDGTGYGAEAARLTRRLVGEFDRPDPEALRALVRLRIRYGFGLEAEADLAAFGDADLADRALLADLARAVEGRAVAAEGPLALAEDCPGAHALWLGIAGVAPAWRGPIQFAAAQEAFAALPPDLRALVGPGLAGRLLDQGRAAEAAAIAAISRRPGLPETPEQGIVAARLLAAEGAPQEALALLRGLAESGAPIAPQALAALARIAFDQGVALPDRMITDLAAAATAARGGPEEVELRGLLVASLGARGALGAAVAEAARGPASPEARAALAARAAAAVAAADPAAVGGAVYAEAALALPAMIGPGVAHDPERRTIAGRLIALGLPNAAIDLLAPATLRGDPGALRLVAAAALALGRPAEARAAVAGLTDPEAARLRATALAAEGAPDRAAAALAAAGVEDAGYAWIAGDWARAQAAEDPARAAMAAYMAGRGGPRSGAVPETPEAAFAQRPSAPARPSLGAARDLIASGRQLDDFLGAVLAEGAEP